MAGRSDRDALPHELFRDILAYCAPDLLCTTTLVSRAFQTDSEALLYRAIRLSRPGQHMELYNALAGHVDRANHIQRLCIDGTFTGSDLRPLFLLLPTLRALQIFNSSFDPGFGTPLPEFAFRLRKLVITDDGVGLLNCAFHAFLEQQQKLECLQLSFASESILAPLCERAAAGGDSDSVFLPALRAVEATPSLLLALVEGGRRPITRVSTYHEARYYPGGSNFVLALCRAVTAGHVDIVALNLSTYNVWETMLQVTSSGAFPRLHSLELMVNTGVRLRKLVNDLHANAKKVEPLHSRLKGLVIRAGLYGLLKRETEQVLRSSTLLLRTFFPGLDTAPGSCTFILHYLGDPMQSFWACPKRTVYHLTET